MFLYLDSSALVKRYVDEPMSEAVRTLMDAAPGAATALITQTEVAAALARAMRNGRRRRNTRGAPTKSSSRNGQTWGGYQSRTHW